MRQPSRTLRSIMLQMSPMLRDSRSVFATSKVAAPLEASRARASLMAGRLSGSTVPLTPGSTWVSTIVRACRSA